MKIDNPLILDHFYITLKEDIFDKFIQLTDILKNSKHRVVKNKKDIWEGIYIFFSNGTYLEILKEEKLGLPLGLALKASALELKTFFKEHSYYHWKSKENKFESGYRYITHELKNTFKLPANNIYSWIMEYPDNLSDKILEKFAKRELNCPVEYNMIAPSNIVSVIKKRCSFFPIPPLITDESIQIIIPQKSSKLTISIKLDTKLTEIIPKSLVFKTNELVSIKSVSSEFFRVISNKNQFCIEFIKKK